MYRIRSGHLEVLLAHPGGPYWQKKDDGAWTFPRGEVHPDEEPVSAAIREFEEETGYAPREPFISLGNVHHRSGKVVHAWAFEGDLDPRSIKSNTFQIEWPPRSGQQQEFPEIDRASFFEIATASRKILPAEFPLLRTLECILEEQGLVQAEKKSEFRHTLFD